MVQYATTCDELRSQLEDVERVIRGTAGADVAGVQRAERSQDAREPFGFRDGVAQPALRAKGAEPPRRGDGTPARFGLWRSIRLGEFVFGYDDADGVRPQAPKGRLGRNGTYVVYRKLRQDMEGFDALVARGSEVIAADVFKAKLVGRWTDGAPLARWPQGPPPDDATGNLNDFRFVRDPLGVQCPVGAHIRRANPRDGTGAGQHMARRHRIIRRGMPYQVAETGERGLVFVCYNVDIERQFELIQRMWLNDGDTLGLGHDPDPIAGSWDPADAGPRRFVIPGERPLAVNLMRPLVTVRGGTYLLLPSMDALRGLSAGEI